MVTIKKKRKRRIRFEGIITFLFLASILGYLGSVTMLRSQNNVLSEEAQNLKAEQATIQNEVDNLELAVKRLDNREIIKEVAEKNGLKMNASQIVSVNE